MRRSRIPTTEDVARAAGVSRATVSYVLNQQAEGRRIPPDTQARVLHAVQSLGYRRNRLATALSTGRTYTVGLVSEIKDHPDVAAWPAPYLKDLFLSVTLAAARAGLNAFLLLQTIDRDLKPEDVADGRVDGVIVFGMQGGDEWVRRVCALGLPCVEIGACRGRYWVDVDNVGGARLAVEHLLSLGHRRIAHFTRTFPSEFILSPRQRAQGFREAVVAAGLSEAEAPILMSAEELAMQFGLDTAPDRRPTALFCYSDYLALCAFDTLCTSGLRVPDDVSLVGFNNDLRAVTMRPELTTVVNPVDDVARAAVALLHRQMEGHNALPEESVTLPTSLFIRDSTAPPPPGRPGKETKK